MIQNLIRDYPARGQRCEKPYRSVEQYETGSGFESNTPVSRGSGTAGSTPGNGAPAPGGSGSGTQTPTGSGTVPAWIASLNDTVIKTDMTAAAAGGTVSETGMAGLFGDLAAELTADNTTLSASQLNDLQTIAANLNVGETASSYVPTSPTP